MLNVDVTPFEIETISRHGDVVRADVYLPKKRCGYHNAEYPSRLKLHERSR